MKKIDFKINGVSFELGTPIEKNKLAEARCKKPGLFSRRMIPTEPGDTVYWAKNCVVSCFGKSIVWASVSMKHWKNVGPRTPNMMYASTAYLFYENNSLKKVTFQLWGNISMALVACDTFEKICTENIGPGHQTSKGYTAWSYNDSILECRLGKKGVWFNWKK